MKKLNSIFMVVLLSLFVACGGGGSQAFIDENTEIIIPPSWGNVSIANEDEIKTSSRQVVDLTANITDKLFTSSRNKSEKVYEKNYH